ncbi:MAG: hypothetical protein LC115_05175 [Bacteroidia bacterium]|nr:hypothetical protein [Bacteroidia bacterium]
MNSIIISFQPTEVLLTSSGDGRHTTHSHREGWSIHSILNGSEYLPEQAISERSESFAPLTGSFHSAISFRFPE